ncbi:MAG: type II toxin-antitoxin system VapC family toxin [Terriglobales bacterium]
MSGFLLDANVISELVKPRPEPAVAKWIDATEENLLCLSVLTFGEIRKEIAALPDGSSRRVSLETWLDHEISLRFAGRILAIDQAITDRSGAITARALATKSPLPVVDGLLAATALQHNLTLVTRNTRDMAISGASVFNPWPSFSCARQRCPT